MKVEATVNIINHFDMTEHICTIILIDELGFMSHLTQNRSLQISSLSLGIVLKKLNDTTKANIHR